MHGMLGEVFPLQLTLKYILILFIINFIHACLRAEVTSRRVLRMFMTIARNSAGVNGLKDF